MAFLLGTVFIIFLSYALTPLHLIKKETVLLISIASLLIYCYIERKSLSGFGSLKGKTPEALAIILFITVLLLRLSVIPGLIAPPHDDPKFHSLLTRMIVETSSLPSTYGHYAPPGFENSSVSYCPGFHSVAAFNSLLLNTSAVDAVMLTTQIYNALIGLTAYFLTKRIFKNWKACLGALFFASFVNSYPNNYWIGGGANAEVFSIFLVLTSMAFLISIAGQRNDHNIFWMGFILTYALLSSHVFASFLLVSALISLLASIEHMRRCVLAYTAGSAVSLLVFFATHQNLFFATYEKREYLIWFFEDFSSKLLPLKGSDVIAFHGNFIFALLHALITHFGTVAVILTLVGGVSMLLSRRRRELLF